MISEEECELAQSSGQHVLVLYFNEEKLLQGQLCAQVLHEGLIFQSPENAKQMFISGSVICKFRQSHCAVIWQPGIVGRGFSYRGTPDLGSGTGVHDFSFGRNTGQETLEDIQHELMIMLINQLIPELNLRRQCTLVFLDDKAVPVCQINETTCHFFHHAGTPALNVYAIIGVVREPDSKISETALMGALLQLFIKRTNMALSSLLSNVTGSIRKLYPETASDEELDCDTPIALPEDEQEMRALLASTVRATAETLTEHKKFLLQKILGAKKL